MFSTQLFIATSALWRCIYWSTTGLLCLDAKSASCSSLITSFFRFCIELSRFLSNQLPPFGLITLTGEPANAKSCAARRRMLGALAAVRRTAGDANKEPRFSAPRDAGASLRRGRRCWKYSVLGSTGSLLTLGMTMRAKPSMSPAMPSVPATRPRKKSSGMFLAASGSCLVRLRRSCGNTPNDALSCSAMAVALLVLCQSTLAHALLGWHKCHRHLVIIVFVVVWDIVVHC